jgi:hypothetical protein
MKKRFYEGEEVVCVDKEMRPATEAAKDAPALIYNNLYVIDKYVHFKYGVWWVSIVGIAECCIYSEMSLAPITQIEELLEDVNEIVYHNQIKRIHLND